MGILDKAFKIVNIIWILVFLIFLYAKNKGISLINEKIVIFVGTLLFVICFRKIFVYWKNKFFKK